MNAVLPGPKTLTELREQVEIFRRQVEETEARLVDLTRGTHELNRAPGIAHKVNSLKDDLVGKRQALANAVRVLKDAEALPGYDDAVASWYAFQAADWESDE